LVAATCPWIERAINAAPPTTTANRRHIELGIGQCKEPRAITYHRNGRLA
jgi:hypothetical protein